MGDGCMGNISLLKAIFNGIIGASMIIVLGKQIFKNKNLKITPTTTFFVAIIVVFIGINTYSENPIIRILASSALSGGIFYLLLDKNITHSIMGSIYISIANMLSEIIICIISIVVFSLSKVNIIIYFNNTLVSNIVVLILSILIINTINMDVESLSYKLKMTANKIIIVITALILLMALILLIKLQINYWILDYEFLVNCILIIMLLSIGLLVRKEQLEIQKTTKEYSDLAKYTKQNEKLIEQYRLERHENKNQLIIIKNLIEQGDTNVIEYVNNLLNIKNKSINNSWISDLQYITIPGVKGFLNYKIQEMLDNKINVELDVSKECSKYKIKKLTIHDEYNIYNLIGIYLDNAKDAAIKSPDKSVSICIYLEKNDLIIEIANSYIDKNILNIIEANSTTKGKGHGYGLKIAKSIINSNQLYKVESNISDDYFVQKIKIKEKVS